MLDKTICYLYGEAANYSDPDAFSSDAALSIPGPEEPGWEADTALFEQLRVLWHIANDPFKALLERMGMNQSQCSRRFCIPLRTVQNWAGEARSAPPYVRLMMAELTGIVKLRKDYVQPPD